MHGLDRRTGIDLHHALRFALGDCQKALAHSSEEREAFLLEAIFVILGILVAPARPTDTGVDI